ncbi:MAG: hypothetical protein IH859_06215, partial [Chloroflexi bacterium]|nr:hypothetical protein [Chloroflexota bacterium]
RSIEPENKLIQEWLLCARKKQLPISTLAEERIYNPFFRFNDENFRTALEIKLNHIFNDPKEIFLITRSLRDAW